MDLRFDNLRKLRHSVSILLTDVSPAVTISMKREAAEVVKDMLILVMASDGLPIWDGFVAIRISDYIDATKDMGREYRGYVEICNMLVKNIDKFRKIAWQIEMERPGEFMDFMTSEKPCPSSIVLLTEILNNDEMFDTFWDSDKFSVVRTKLREVPYSREIDSILSMLDNRMAEAIMLSSIGYESSPPALAAAAPVEEYVVPELQTPDGWPVSISGAMEERMKKDLEYRASMLKKYVVVPGTKAPPPKAPSPPIEREPIRQLGRSYEESKLSREMYPYGMFVGLGVVHGRIIFEDVIAKLHASMKPYMPFDPYARIAFSHDKKKFYTLMYFKSIESRDRAIAECDGRDLIGNGPIILRTMDPSIDRRAK